MRVLLGLAAFAAAALLLASCGSDTHTTPIVPPSSNVVFLQKVPDASFAPMLGTFSNNQLTASSIKDPSTQQEVYGNFHSIILSPNGKSATFDFTGALRTHPPVNGTFTSEVSMPIPSPRSRTIRIRMDGRSSIPPERR